MEINIDENLIRQYRKGDEKSFEILIQKYLKSLYNFVYHYVGNYDDAQEVVQEVFLNKPRTPHSGLGPPFSKLSGVI